MEDKHLEAIEQKEMASDCAREGLIWNWEKFPYQRICQVLEQTSQGSGWVIIPGGI